MVGLVHGGLFPQLKDQWIGIKTETRNMKFGSLFTSESHLVAMSIEIWNKELLLVLSIYLEVSKMKFCF